MELNAEDISRLASDITGVLFGQTDRLLNAFLSSTPNLSSAFDAESGTGSFHVMLTDSAITVQTPSTGLAGASQSNGSEGKGDAYMSFDERMTAAQALDTRDRRVSKACVKCQLRGKKCSDFPDCESCLNLKKVLDARVFANQTRCLRYMDCFDLDLMAFNPFGEYNWNFENELDFTTFVDENDVYPFTSAMPWNIESICAALGRRIQDSSDRTCWTITSLTHEMLDDVRREFGREFVANYRFVVDPYVAMARLLEKQANGYAIMNQSNAGTDSALSRAVAISGGRVLQRLEKALSARSLPSYPRPIGMALFVILHGIILGSGHSRRIRLMSSEPHIYDKMADRLDHLTRALAHYLIYIGLRLDFIDDQASPEHIFDAAKRLSRQRNSFFLCATRFGRLAQSEPPSHLPPRRKGCVLDGLGTSRTSGSSSGGGGQAKSHRDSLR